MRRSENIVFVVNYPTKTSVLYALHGYWQYEGGWNYGGSMRVHLYNFTRAIFKAR